jgi:hypothetical protein
MLSLCIVTLLVSPALAQCQEPGSEPITQERLDELLDDPMEPGLNQIACCCYDNWNEYDHSEVLYEDQDWCCEENTPGCVTKLHVDFYEIIPTVTSGKWNVDNDHDGDWDEGPPVSKTGYWSDCHCPGQLAQPCFDWFPLETESSFICEDCD